MLKNKIKTITITLLISILSITSGFAGEFEASGDITTVSTYVWRGVQSYNGVAMQGTVAGAYGPVSAGVWFSTVNFGDKTTLEVDPYAEVGFSLGEVETALGVVVYTFDLSSFNDGAKYEYELYASFAYDFLGLTAFYVPKQGSTDLTKTASLVESNYWLEVSAGTDLAGLSWGATLGYGTYSSRWLETPKKDATGNLVLSAEKSLTDLIAVNWNYSLGIDGDMNNYFWAGLGFGF